MLVPVGVSRGQIDASEVVINSRSGVTRLQPFTLIALLSQGQVGYSRPTLYIGKVSMYFWFVQLQAVGAVGLLGVELRNA